MKRVRARRQAAGASALRWRAVFRAENGAGALVFLNEREDGR